MNEPTDGYAPEPFLFEAAHNSDQTEGRGHMEGFRWFRDLAAAVEAVKGEGVMGVGDGDVYALYLLTDLDSVNGNRGPIRREKVYGQSWTGTDRGQSRYAPGWDPRGQDPEWGEYQRLRAKFETSASGERRA